MRGRGKILCVDFDGVIHSYTSGWKGAETVSDPPVPGAMEWLLEMDAERFGVAIFSSRSGQPGGIGAMRGYIRYCADDAGLDSSFVDRLEFPTEKPQAFMSIDDRGFRFEGTFPSLTELDAFRPWNRR